jgi:hypothetical protein
MLPRLPTLYPASPPTAFNPHRDALAAYCKSPYRQCSARRHPHPRVLPAEHCRYGTTDFAEHCRYGTTDLSLVIASLTPDPLRNSSVLPGRASLVTNPESAGNCFSMFTHDRGFALVYLGKADALLKVLKHADKQWWGRACDTLAAAKQQLEAKAS